MNLEMLTIAERRARVVAESMEWIGTPYMNNARVKGKNGGADCLTFLADVFANAGEIERLPIPKYPHDWHLNQTAELYLFGKDDTPGVLSFCNELEWEEPLPADVILFKFGHCFSHSAIVIEWPIIIHAWRMRPVSRDDYSKRTVLRTIHEDLDHRNEPRPKRLYRLKTWDGV